ncbi:MAG: hypothetical protein COA67_04775 [Lutibacter sp.]|nr:MAG: hypothetical protein COA67_04775 [Lutibacter sp.]
MKKLLYITLILFYTISFSQQDSIRPFGKVGLNKTKERKEFVTEFVKKLNSFNENEKIPSFFYEHDFDDKNKKYWVSRHSAISLRKLIIEKIDNVTLLKAVLKSKSRRIKKKKRKKRERGYFVVFNSPFQEYSNYDLVKFRLEEIWNDGSMGKNAPNYPKEGN